MLSPRRFRLASVAVALILAFSVGRTLRAELVSHYPFDGSLEDAGPGGNDGAFFGGDTPVFTEGFDGTENGAILFDGVDDYVQLATTNGLPISNAPAFTVAFWVKGPAQADKRVFSEGSSTDNNPLFNIGTPPSGTGQLNSFLRPGPGHRQSARTAYDDTWHHVAWVDNAGNVDVYIDGIHDPANLDYARVELLVDRVAVGGILRGAPCCYFNGAVDDLRIFDEALTEEEVQTLIPTPGCPEEGDTHCGGLELVEEPLGGVGWHVFQASATDDGADSGVYTFFATGPDGSTQQIGPQDDPMLEIYLFEGKNTVAVRVDDELGCFDRAEDDTCTLEVEVAAEPLCVSHWSFDGDLLDSGPGMNHGTFFGADSTTFTEGYDGTPDGAVLFDGVDDYVSFMQANALPIYGNRAYSVALWVKGPAQSDRRVFSEGSTANNTPLLNVGTDNTGATGSLDIFIRPSGTLVGHVKSNQVAFDDTWHHVVWVDDGGEGTMWIDGIRDAVMPTYAKPDFAALDTATAGGILRATPCCFYQGALDDIRIYNYALSEEEIVALVPEPDDCDAADTHCTDLSVVGPEGDVEGTWILTANGTDDGAEDPIVWTFLIDLEDGSEIQIGPQESPTAEIQLPAGAHSIRAVADDRLLCRDVAGDATCMTDVVVRTSVPAEVAHLTFDGTLADATGNGNDGMYVGEDPPPYVESFDCTPETALSFDGVDDYVELTPMDGVPVSSQRSYSVSLWVRGLPQADKRVYSEESAAEATTLFNIGTDNTGTTGAVDIYIRSTGGLNPHNHTHSTRTAFDGEWHHIVWTDDNGDAALFIDGERDETDFSYAKPALAVDVAHVGGVVRPTREPPPCCLFTGDIDEVRLFNYVVSSDEIAELYGEGPSHCCPVDGDTHCGGLAISGPEGGGPGTYTATATATDDSTDAISYTFSAQKGDEDAVVIGPQAEPTAEFELDEGTWTLTVAVDDDPECEDEAPDASCSEEVVVSPPGVGPFVRGDVDVDGERVLTDSIRIFGFLFLGDPAPECMAAADTNGQGVVDISSGIYLLQWLFSGGPDLPEPSTCGFSTVPSDIELGCEVPCTP